MGDLTRNKAQQGNGLPKPSPRGFLRAQVSGPRVRGRRSRSHPVCGAGNASRGWLACPRSQDLGLDFTRTPGLPTRALGARRPGAPARSAPGRPGAPPARRPGSGAAPAGPPVADLPARPHPRQGLRGAGALRGQQVRGAGPGAGRCAGSAGTITSDGRCARGRAAGAAGNQRETQTRQGRSSSPSGLFTRRGWRTPRPVT